VVGWEEASSSGAGFEVVAVVGFEVVAAAAAEGVLVVESGDGVVCVGDSVVDLEGDGAVAGDVGAVQAVGFDGGALVGVESASVVGDVDDVGAVAYDDGEERVVEQDLADRLHGDGSDAGDLTGLTSEGVAAQQGGVVDVDDDLDVVAAGDLGGERDRGVGVPRR
jgi:hypothetical protein